MKKINFRTFNGGHVFVTPDEVRGVESEFNRPDLAGASSMLTTVDGGVFFLISSAAEVLAQISSYGENG